jgi:hypothetical protein
MSEVPRLPEITRENLSVDRLSTALRLPAPPLDSFGWRYSIWDGTGHQERGAVHRGKMAFRSNRDHGRFFAGLSLRLPPGLACIIGPRGSGKSTLIEAFRYGMGGLSGASKGRADLIQANLGAAIITVRTAPDNQGVAHLIRRSLRQPPTLSTADGKAISEIDLDSWMVIVALKSKPSRMRA